LFNGSDEFAKDIIHRSYLQLSDNSKDNNLTIN